MLRWHRFCRAVEDRSLPSYIRVFVCYRSLVCICVGCASHSTRIPVQLLEYELAKMELSGDLWNIIFLLGLGTM